MKPAPPLPTIVVDTREPPHTAWDFADLGVPTTRAKLDAGDYSIVGLERRVVIERKELGDFVSTLTAGRARFERELARLETYERAAVVVEGDLEEVILGRYRSSVSPRALVGSCASFWARWRVPVIWAGSRRNAQIIAAAMLTKCAKHLLAPAPAAAPTDPSGDDAA